MKKILMMLNLLLGGLLLPVYADTPPNRLFTNHFNGWVTYSGDHAIHKRLSIHLEIQVRTHSFTGMQQLLLRPALNVHLSPQVMLTAGYAFVQTWPYGAFPVLTTFPEHRAYQQLQLLHYTGRVEWVNRLRMEERFSRLPVKDNAGNPFLPDDFTYTNRARILNRLSIPFKGKQIEDNSLYVTLHNEVFFNFGKKVGMNLLDQNRACVALGYKIPKAGRLELGFMEQTIIKSDGLHVENNHTLLLSFSSAVSFIKKKKDK